MFFQGLCGKTVAYDEAMKDMRAEIEVYTRCLQYRFNCKIDNKMSNDLTLASVSQPDR